MADLSKIVCLEQDCRHGAEQTGGSGSGNDTYTKAEIDSKDADIRAAASEAKSAANNAQSVNQTQDGQIKALQEAVDNLPNNIGTITGIKMNGVSKGTSGVVDLGTVITKHQDVSGKVNNTLDGANSLLSKITKVYTASITGNTYFIRKNPGGTNEFGLIKFSTLWEYIKTNIESFGYIGTITGIKMNGASKGTSGVVDLGTVITKHQDISGKQDKSTAVTHTANTAVGSATKPVYIAANGAATPITHSINADVPANAKFTDTTYNDATQSAHGLMTAADKKKLDKIIEPTRYLRYNATGGMVKDTWYKFASFTCTQQYNYSTAIFAAGYSYTRLSMFRIVAGTAQGKPTAERIWVANITGDAANSIGYIISGNTINFFIKTTTGVYGYVGRLAASAETGDYIQQIDLVAATSAETTAIVPIGNIVTDISASNTASKLATARKINTVAFDGTKDITIPRSNLYVHAADGKTGTAGYALVATLTVTSTYANMPTIIRYTNRNGLPTELMIRFANVNSKDPTVSIFSAACSAYDDTRYRKAYLNKSASGTWDLYITKSEAYDTVRIIDMQNAFGVNVTFKDALITALPSTAISPIFLGTTGWISMTKSSLILGGGIKYRLDNNRITVSGAFSLKQAITASLTGSVLATCDTLDLSGLYSYELSCVAHATYDRLLRISAHDDNGTATITGYPVKASGETIPAYSTFYFTMTGYLDGLSF